MRLNSGYYSVPAGVYFNGSFTTSVWVNAKSKINWVRVFDFGVNGVDSDNVVLGLFKDTTPSVSFFSILSGSSVSYLDCNLALVLNEWTHLAVTFDGSLAYYYYNGILCSSTSNLHQPSNVTRSKNFIGKSNWDDEPADAVYDEFRIYNRALDQNEINSLMFI